MDITLCSNLSCDYRNKCPRGWISEDLKHQSLFYVNGCIGGMLYVVMLT